MLCIVDAEDELEATDNAVDRIDVGDWDGSYITTEPITPAILSLMCDGPVSKSGFGWAGRPIA